MAKPKLSKAEQTFADTYLTNGFNATRAYITAHPRTSEATAAVQASRLLRKPNITEYLNTRYAEQVMSAEEALNRVATIARADLSQYEEGGFINLDAMKEDGLGFLLKGISYKPNGITELQFHDSYKALEDILKAHGKLIEKLELSGSVDTNAQVTIYLPDNGRT